MTNVELPRTIATTLTADGTLVAGTHTPVDASAGVRTVLLPVATHVGAHLSVEKRDVSTNAVVISGSIRGATTTISLVWQFETVTLRWSGTTWIPTEGHKTKASLDAAYGASQFNPRLFGAKGDGTTDDSAAFIAMRDAVLSTRRTGETGGNKPVNATIYIPPGRYLLTQNDALMNYGRGDASGVQGLTIRGAGRRATTLVWSPTVTSTTDPTVGNLFSAYKRAHWFSMSDFNIEVTNTAANVFYFFDEGSGAQNEGCVFERIHISGDCNRAWGFDGSVTANLNSEMTFRNVTSSGAYTDAYFHVGGISGLFNQQNQFLNYWFYGSGHVLKGGTLYRFDRGGFAAWHGGSWSAGASTDPAMTFVSMPQSNFNNTAATTFEFDMIRLEPKASSHVVIDCRLGQGIVTWRNCSDVSSLQFGSSAGYNLHKYAGGTPWGVGVGPTVRYIDCTLAGYHSYDGAGAAQVRGGFVYDGCYIYRGGNAAVAATSSGTDAVLQYANGTPAFSFKNGWNYSDDPAALNAANLPAVTVLGTGGPFSATTSNAEIATALRTQVTVPPSGRISIRLEAWVNGSAGSTYLWTYTIVRASDSATLASPSKWVATGATSGWVSATQVVTLTPGTLVEIRWGHSATAVGPTVSADSGSSRTMTLTATPL